MRDGGQLSGILYLPANHNEPTPAIFAMTPYIAQSHHESARHYARHGYPFLSVDVRGRGNSEGRFHFLNEAQDGYDVVEWLAMQGFCNGQVAMWGSSYLGYCQWVIAAQRPPHLATIIPVSAAFQGVDFPLRNNVFLPYAEAWLTLIAGYPLQDKLFADGPFWRDKSKESFKSGMALRNFDTFIGNPSALFQEWLSHPELDDYWDRHNPRPEQYSTLSIPVLTITGAYDADQPGALEHYLQHVRRASAAISAKHYLIVGPWDHRGCAVPEAEFCGLKVGPASLIDMRRLHRQWYAWTMQGGEKPEFLKKNVAYYVAGAEKWRYADTLEGVTSRSEPLYLSSTQNPTDLYSSGSLNPNLPVSAEPDHYLYDPRDVSHAEFESTVDPYSFVDQKMLHLMMGKQLVYHSVPFERDTELSGFFKFSAWIAIDQPDTDFRAMVYEVALDGSVIMLSIDWLRARYRESLRKAKLIDTREPLRYDFEHFTFISRQILKGHRLRLVVGPINSIHWQKNHNSGGIVAEESMDDARPVTVRLFHDGTYPSALYVPFGHEN